MRVLHVIDVGAAPGPGWVDAAAGAAGAVVRGTGHEHTVALVGSDAGVARALRAGVGGCPSVVRIAGSGAGAARALWRVVVGAGPFDVVHAWAPVKGLRAVRRLVTVSPLGEPVESGAVVAPSAAAAERLRAEGQAAAGVVAVPAAVEGGREAARARVRREMGLSEEDAAVLLVGDAPRADAVRFAFLMSLLAVAGRHAVGILPAWAGQMARADRFVRGVARARVIVSARPLAELVAAADLGVFDGGGAGPTSCAPPAPWAAGWAIAHAHSAGVPVVAPAWAATEDLYAEPVRQACVAHNSTLPELARRLMALVGCAAQRREIGRAAAAHAGAEESATRLVGAVERLWASAAG